MKAYYRLMIEKREQIVMINEEANAARYIDEDDYEPGMELEDIENDKDWGEVDYDETIEILEEHPEYIVEILEID